MEKTLIKMTRTDVGLETDVHIHGDNERLAVAISLTALFIKDEKLARLFSYVLEENLNHPEILEKNSITVEGGMPWHDKPNNQ